MMQFLTSAVTNWKTSALGTSLILGAVADGLHQIGTGVLDPAMVKTDIAAVAAGWGLLVAKDHTQ